MKYKKLLYIPLAVVLMSSCGSDSEPVQETAFYKKENVSTKQLKLSIEASGVCLLYTSPSPRDRTRSRMPSSA